MGNDVSTQIVSPFGITDEKEYLESLNRLNRNDKLYPSYDPTEFTKTEPNPWEKEPNLGVKGQELLGGANSDEYYRIKYLKYKKKLELLNKNIDN